VPLIEDTWHSGCRLDDGAVPNAEVDSNHKAVHTRSRIHAEMHDNMAVVGALSAAYAGWQYGRRGRLRKLKGKIRPGQSIVIVGASAGYPEE
jgi:hypothetical protein